MTSYEEYRKGYTRVLAEEITTEAEVFSKWIRNVYSREVKDEIARLESQLRWLPIPPVPEGE